MENLWLSVPPLIAGILIPVIHNIIGFRKRKHKAATATLELLGSTEKYESDFLKEFIIPDFEENYFHLQTGIKTNSTSIKKYIELKRKLGKNFTWKTIRIAKQYLNVSGQEVKVSIDKFSRFSKSVGVYGGIIMLLCAIGISIYFSTQIESWQDAVFSLTIVIVLIMFGLFSFTSINNITTALIIERRLKQVSMEDEIRNNDE